MDEDEAVNKWYPPVGIATVLVPVAWLNICLLLKYNTRPTDTVHHTIWQ
jgi:hypothetical protein